ncbi:thyrotropin-releasing hormone-degrading ectoenzyme isoform X4 [Mastomys coucha]|uniref:thyrotropin-releasing hormone-degrading ectoenzyme isoform X4 n=1 Tax=Mastomys coucha TaxID=35658 RepID=UPI0012624F7F|nr:thyrotropin-releasing hormone-degrading ectoenzyme isoform X4 [Mastomys coucha]
MALDGERGEQEEEKKKKKKKKKRKKKEEEGAEKSSSPFAATMGEDDAALRASGRGLSDPWADSVGVRPRTTERHIAVHKRLVLAFAVSIVALLAVTMLAVLLSLRFDECGASAAMPGTDGGLGGFPERGGNSSYPGSARRNHHAGGESSQQRESSEVDTPGTPSAQPPSEEEQEPWQPWTQLRLSGHLKPLHYNLMLTAFMENFTFSGEVNVEIACRNATRYVVLHASRVAVEKVQVAEDRAFGAVPVAGFFLYPQTQVLVVVLNRTLDAQRHYNLKIIYNALIENELLGFFRSSYVIHGERRFLGVTQFSPTHARKAFPCFDEPIYKATFKISIKHQATYLSLSNMPVETSVFEEDGWVRLYARPDAIRRGSGDYALHITKRLIEFYEDYFKVPYSLPKLDLLAVPKHPYAAMENWGLSIFVEQRILLDPSVSSISYLLDVTMVIVHEICHQWFGDLVTPVWWEDVWLKEGFAHYFEFVGTDYLYPAWNMEKQRFLTDVLHEVMLLDGLASSHPVSQEVLQATDIDKVFDWIAYKKGAALIRMLANFMGHSVFQRGLQDYLTIHKYGNAARNDLWNTLTEALKRNGKYVNIQEVMDQWTLQMGYPVITILGNMTAENRILITQQHFIYDIGAKTKALQLQNSSYLWQIPLTIVVGNRSHVSSEAIIWVSNKSEHHRITYLDKGSWILGNINQAGYFRVNYDLRNWRLLIDQLIRNHEVLSVSNRAALIDDAFSLARAGYLPQNIPLEIIRYLSQEKDFLPWHAASRALYPLDKLLDRMENYNIFNEYILKQVATTYIKLGWPKNNFNGSLVQASYQHEELRREVIMLACSFGNKHCHQQASTLISDWISSNRNRIPLNVRDIVYCTGVSLLDEDVWEFIWMKFHSTTAVSEKKILLEALTCSDDRNLLSRLLNLSLNSEVVLDQDAIDVIIHVARNPHGRDLAWKFFRDKWKILNTRYGEALFMNSKLISGVTEFLNTEGELKELKNFMKSYDGVASASFSRAVETVEANVRWKRLYQDELFQWLGKALRHYFIHADLILHKTTLHL